MIRNSDINDPDNAEIHGDVWIIVVILYQFRIISVIEGFSLLLDCLLPVAPLDCLLDFLLADTHGFLLARWSILGRKKIP
jgi:hypothetical protein